MNYQRKQTDEQTVICEGACVVGDVTLAPGVSVWYNAVVRGDEGAISIGADTNIQDCAVVHAETVIGAGCTVGHGAILHGCTVGGGCLIGMGSILLTGAVLEEGCLVGAGAVVTGKTHAPAGSVLLGNPARIVKTLTPEEMEKLQEGVEEYIRLAKDQLTPLPK